jgi:hypothetical protein
MKTAELVDYWITKHNKHYFKYSTEEEEPRYELKTFFLYSYRFLKTLEEGWGDYLVGYSNLFRRDPANDYYKYRDPTENGRERQNSLEWVAAFEIFADVGFPHNESATMNFLKYSRMFLEKAKRMPDSEWMDFILCSAVANLPTQFEDIKRWLPSQLEKYVKERNPSPHALMIYLKALRRYDNQKILRQQTLSKLIEWIKNPNGTFERQLSIWARLITTQWIPELSDKEIKQMILDNFTRSLEAVYGIEWSNSPMVLEASYLIADSGTKKTIEKAIASRLAPASFVGMTELFDFLIQSDNALEVQDAVRKVKEKCKGSISRNECKDCITNKRDDCWIRILSKLTRTEPKLHSGYEVADKVIYSLQQGIYIVVKAEEIAKQTGEGDVLYRQCVQLFSVDHALVLYLNPFDTAPIVIEAIKKAASTSKTNPVFEIIDQKYVRQIYREYVKCG